MTKYIQEQQAVEIADTILAGFNKHYSMFRDFSAQAKELFEYANWMGIQSLVANRINMYSIRVRECVEILKDTCGNHSIFNDDIWKTVKALYITKLINHKQPELAETFFNSVSTKFLDKNYYKNQFMFVKPAISTDYIDSDIGTFRCFYPKTTGLRGCVKLALQHFNWKLPFADISRDVSNILHSAKKHFKKDWPPQELNLNIQILYSPFYRNKCSYIFGMIVNGHLKHPFALAIVHNNNKQLYVDAALFKLRDIATLFSFSRAYFLVDMDVPSAYVNFLTNLLPMRKKSDFYTMLGLQKQSKNIFYREFIEHLRYSEDKFELAAGTKGLVMIVFTMPSFMFVFKIIKDKFGPNKDFNEKHVINKYNLVKKHDRVGRLADTLEYSNVAIPLSRIDDKLMNELKQEAQSKVEITHDKLIIKHVYIERRLIPLNLYLLNATPEERESLIIDYGTAIKELASANIFPGDMLFKNFGVTSYGRLIFYDYDEIEYMTSCNFKKIPEAPYPELELSDEVWYPVHKEDVFPEEFATFLLGEPDLRKIFMKHHKDLLDEEFWNAKKEKIKNGIIEDFYPYPLSERFVLNKKQRGTNIG